MAAVADLRCSLLCRRLAEACQGLAFLFITADPGKSWDVLYGLHKAQLGNTSDGRPRDIRLLVPGR